MISKSNNITEITEILPENSKYVYLFRGWRTLLQTAQTIKNIWIVGYDKKRDSILKLHSKCGNMNSNEEGEF